MLKKFKKMSKQMLLVAGSTLGVLGAGLDKAHGQDTVPADLPARRNVISTQLGSEGYMIPYWGAYSLHLSGKTTIAFGADNGRKPGIFFLLGTRYRFGVEPYEELSTYNNPTTAGFDYSSGYNTISIGADGIVGAQGRAYFGAKKRNVLSVDVNGKIPLWQDGKSGLGVEAALNFDRVLKEFTRTKDELSPKDQKNPEKRIKGALSVGPYAVVGFQRAQRYDAAGNPTGRFQDQLGLPYFQVGAGIKISF